MDTLVKRLYEGMFLVDAAETAGDWDGIVAHVTSLIEKHGGSIVTLKRWDDRKLAYEVDRKTRGTYILVYFDAPTEAISKIEREVVLSERLLRLMVLRTDKMSQEDIAKDTPLEAIAKGIKKQEALAAKDDDDSSDDSEE